MRHPFFATLALFAPIRTTKAIDTAATDGESLYFNPKFIGGLTDSELDGLLTHEVLHAALLHTIRRGTRTPELWNIACDIVVNGMAREAGLALPKGAVEHPPWEALSAEEIYHRLVKGRPEELNKLVLVDLMEPGQRPDNTEESPFAHKRGAVIRAHWKAALQQARVVAARSSSGQGVGGAGMGLEWDAVTQPQLDWKTVLWRHLVRTPTDFSGFDRRFIGRGMYLDALDGEEVEVTVCVDTSGSIGDHELDLFLSEIRGILGSYPHIRCQLFFADWDLYGPYELAKDTAVPTPEGGGGTTFVPFFEWLAEHPSERAHIERLAVYLTDGYGEFPEEPPEEPVLWVVTGDGLESDGFPFGEVARLLAD
jgi:predicted metal-dependent peptidase